MRASWSLAACARLASSSRRSRNSRRPFATRKRTGVATLKPPPRRAAAEKPSDPEAAPKATPEPIAPAPEPKPRAEARQEAAAGVSSLRTYAYVSGAVGAVGLVSFGVF